MDCAFLKKWLINGHDVETVVLLSQLRHKPDDYIDVDVDVDESEGTSAETKATYIYPDKAAKCTGTYLEKIEI